MNRRSLPVVLLAVCATMAFTASVSAMYHPTLGRFAQRDPKGYADGMGLYEYCRSGPAHNVDPRGTKISHVRAYSEIKMSSGKVLKVTPEGFDRKMMAYLSQQPPGIEFRLESQGARAGNKDDGLWYGEGHERLTVVGVKRENYDTLTKGHEKGTMLVEEMLKSPRDIEVFYHPGAPQAFTDKPDPITGGASIRFDPSFVSKGYAGKFSDKGGAFWAPYEANAAAFGHELLHHYYWEHPDFRKPGMAPNEPVMINGRQPYNPDQVANDEIAIVDPTDRSRPDQKHSNTLPQWGGYHKIPPKEMTPISENDLRREMQMPTRQTYSVFDIRWLRDQGATGIRGE